MFRKMMFAMCILVVFSLLGSGLTLASEGIPTWEIVLDPGDFMEGDYYIESVEEFKGDLYAVAKGEEGQGGRLFRSPDGKNWEVITEAGFGLGAVEDDCGTNYYDNSWDMIVFQDKLYLLPFEESCYLRPGLVMRTSDGVNWETVVTAEDLGLTWSFWDYIFYGQFHKLSEFQGRLYVNVEYYNPEADLPESAIYRSPQGDPGTWEEVIIFPGWIYPGTFHIFNGALYEASDYVVTPEWDDAPEQIWRTFDGTNWEMVIGDGFGNPGSDGLGGFADYKGYLYVGAETGEGDGAQLWRSPDGVAWEPVSLEGLLSSNDWKVEGVNVYQGELYAHINNCENGMSVFRTKDTSTWQRVNTPGFGNPNWCASHHNAGQVVFRDDLYMGTIGYHGVLLKLVHPDE